MARTAIINPTLAPAGYAIVFRCLALLGVSLGAVDAVSGASTTLLGVRTVSPAGPLTTNATGTVGANFNYRFVTNPLKSPNTAADYFKASPLPPGLTVNTNMGGIGDGYGYISGVPTVAGQTYPVTISAANNLYRDAGGNLIWISTNIWITITGGGGGTAPTITTQPVSQTVTEGGNVTFTVVATGSPAPTYQWRKDGATIGGATSASYTITGVARTDAASYTVLVSNASGNLASSAAVLTVNYAPAITAQPASQTVTAGNPVTFSVTATGNPAPTYQWKKGGVNIPGATASSYTIAATATGDSGDYAVLVANSVNSLTSSIATLTVNAAGVAPTITSQPASVTVNSGSPASFTVVATGTPAPTYQWKRNGTDIPGATAATYTIASAQPSDAASYTVFVSNASGNLTSSPATLAVNVAPTITTQPASVTVNSGSAASFTVVATGTPNPTYQWKKNGTDIGGATAATYSIASVQSGDAASYTVVVSNTAGSVTSLPASLTVQVGPVITSQPVSVTATSGSSASFTVVATGSPAPGYQWKKDGVDIGGATSATYSIASVQVSDGGSYTVVISNPAGSVTSAAATLTVNVAPAITSQPVNATVTSGSAASFTVVATGTPAPTYQWKKNGTDIGGATSATLSIASAQPSDVASYTVVVSNVAGSVTSTPASLAVNVAPAITSEPISLTVTSGSAASFTVVATGTPAPTYQWKKNGTDIGGATAATYTIASAQPSDVASYTVVVSNVAGSVISAPASLTVNVAPAITTQPVSITVTSGGSASFSVVATGTPAATYQWKKNGTDISGATSATLTLATVNDADAGSYTVVVSNPVSSVTSAPATLTVSAALVAPTITSQPASVTVTSGSTASFTVVASGNPTPTYQWQKNGTDIAGATSATLSIASAQTSDAASYTVVVSNSEGSVTSNPATLSVNVAPAITTQPVSITVTSGGSASFTVVATGTPEPTYQWKKAGSDIVGATSATYTIASVKDADAASYTVVVSNAAGSVTSAAATLTVIIAPTITAQPAALTVDSGATASFSVTADGTAPLAYQWYFNGTAIAGQTAATLSLSNVQDANAGDYTVSVSNAAGSVTSAAAKLTVTPVTLADLKFTEPAVPGADGLFHLSLTGPLNKTYIIWASTDLTTWTQIKSIAVTSVPVEYIDTDSAATPVRFYKATIAP